MSVSRCGQALGVTDLCMFLQYIGLHVSFGKRLTAFHLRRNPSMRDRFRNDLDPQVFVLVATNLAEHVVLTDGSTPPLPPAPTFTSYTS